MDATRILSRSCLQVAAIGAALLATPARADVIVAGDTGAAPLVRSFGVAPARQQYALNAFSSSFAGGVRVAAGDLDGDGVPEVVAAVGSGAAPQVRVFDGRSGEQVHAFLAYGASFTGGVRVAVGDLTGDGVPDIVTGTGAGAPGHVKVFDGVTHAEVRSFFAFPAAFTGGVSVAAGDVNGDGRADVIVGAAADSSHVRVFSGTDNSELHSFFAFAGFTGGVNVAGGDVNGDGRAEVIVGAASSASHVKVFDGASGAEIRSFFAFAPTFAGGVRVAAGDVNGDGLAELIVGAGAGAPPHVRVFDGASLAEVDSFLAFEGSTFTQGVNLAFAPPPRSGYVGFEPRTYTRAEGGRAIVGVGRFGGAAGPASVHWQTEDDTAVAGVDYLAASGDLHWADGEQGIKTFSVRLLEDDTHEAGRATTLRLRIEGLPAFGAADAVIEREDVAVIAIRDDDPLPVVSLEGPATANEGQQNVNFSVVLDRRSNRDVVVVLGARGTATPREDYRFIGTQVVVPAGSFGVTRSLNPNGRDIVPDAVADPGETIDLNVLRARGATVNPDAALLSIEILE